METNYFTQIMNSVWVLMSTEFTIYGFTLSYASVFCWSLLVILCLRAVCFYLFTVR